MRSQFRRVPVQANVRQRSRSATFPAPTRGLVLSESAAAGKPGGATILDNWFPTQTGIRLRGGCRKVATIGTGPVVSMFTYVSGVTRRLFAASLTSVFDITAPADLAVPPAAAFSGQANGYYSFQNFATPGGEFLYIVNGTNKPRLFDGASWLSVDGASSPSLSGAGLDVSRLIHVFAFKSRLFFIERNSMNAWFLEVDSIGGVLKQLSLRGVFQRGGSLLTGATWSLDAGDGLSEQCVFISTEGEVAIFQGTDPASANGWALKGRYDIAPPMGRRALLSIGGDLLVATREGIVPLSEAISRDRTTLGLAAVTRQIEPLWKADVRFRDTAPWELIKWPAMNMGVAMIPPEAREPVNYVVNMQTGAWARYVGWRMQCMALHNDLLYFGTPEGKVMLAENGGSDDGVPYTCTYVGTYDHLRAVGATKQIHTARSSFIASQPFTPRFSVGVDYAPMLPPAPSSTPEAAEADKWDQGLWDVARWDAGVVSRVSTRWNSIGASGVAIAPQVQVTCGATATPDAELISFDLMYEPGGVMV